MLKVMLPSTPQGKILAVKFAGGVLAGVLAYFTAEYLTGPQLFMLTLALYTVISLGLMDLARKASPKISLSFYAFFKGFLTYYIALYLTWLTINVMCGGEVVFAGKQPLQSPSPP